MKSVSILLILLMNISVWAQERKHCVYMGVIKGRQNEKVDYAVLHLKQNSKYFLTDENGVFEIQIDDCDNHDVLIIKALGFEKYEVSTDKLKNQIFVEIQLIPAPHMLNPVDIIAIDYKKIIQQAAIKLQVTQKAEYQNLFYQQMHKENNKYVRLIEAQIAINHKYNSFEIYSPSYNLQALRRSKVYEKNGAEHDNHIHDLMQKNVIYNPLKSPFNTKAHKFYKFDKGDCDNIPFGAICISYVYKCSSDPIAEYGKLIIDTINSLPVYVEQHFFPNKNFTIGASGRDVTNWFFIQGHMYASYFFNDNKIETDSIVYNYTHKVYDAVIKQTEYVVEESFNAWFVKQKDYTPLEKLKYKSVLNLYKSSSPIAKRADKYRINPPVQALKDLEKIEPLSVQCTCEWVY